MSEHAEHHQPPLSPRRTRLLTFTALALIALGAIWLIDHRAMQRMHEYDSQHRAFTPALSEPHPGASEGRD